MAEGDIGGSGAVQQAATQQQTTTTNAEQAALQQQETVKQEAVAAQAAPAPVYLKTIVAGAQPSQYEQATGQLAPWTAGGRLTVFRRENGVWRERDTTIR